MWHFIFVPRREKDIISPRIESPILPLLPISFPTSHGVSGKTIGVTVQEETCWDFLPSSISSLSDGFNDTLDTLDRIGGLIAAGFSEQFKRLFVEVVVIVDMTTSSGKSVLEFKEASGKVS